MFFFLEENYKRQQQRSQQLFPLFHQFSNLPAWLFHSPRSLHRPSFSQSNAKSNFPRRNISLHRHRRHPIGRNPHQSLPIMSSSRMATWRPRKWNDIYSPGSHWWNWCRNALLQRCQMKCSAMNHHWTGEYDYFVIMLLILIWRVLTYPISSYMIAIILLIF